MKLWAFFFVPWIALCGVGYACLHPEVAPVMGVLPGDLPVEVTPLESPSEIEVMPA